MSIEGQGHFFTIYFPGFVCFVLYLAKISGECLQDHWSSGLLDPLKPHFYYISTGLRGSFSHGDFSMIYCKLIIKTFVVLSRTFGMQKEDKITTRNWLQARLTVYPPQGADQSPVN